jgi:hypothetical protein
MATFLQLFNVYEIYVRACELRVVHTIIEEDSRGSHRTSHAFWNIRGAVEPKFRSS